MQLRIIRRHISKWRSVVTSDRMKVILIQVKTTKAAVEDLARYCGALDK